MPKNPFQVLGLDIRELKGLKIDQLQLIIESQYRALQKIHHPDHGGSGEKSRLLNLAKSELATEDGLNQWLASSLKKSKSSKLETDLERAVKLVRVQQGFGLKLYLAMYRLSSTGRYVDLLGLGDRVLLLRRNIASPRKLPIGFGNEFEKEEERLQARYNERQRWIDRSFFRLRIADGKLLEENYLGEIKDISDHLLVGTITDGTVRHYFNQNSSSIYKLLATVCPTDDKARGLPFNYRVGGNEGLVVDVPAARFASVFPFVELSARITKRDECFEFPHLFSMRVVGGKIVFRLEGTLALTVPKAQEYPKRKLGREE